VWTNLPRPSNSKRTKISTNTSQTQLKLANRSAGVSRLAKARKTKKTRRVHTLQNKAKLFTTNQP